MSKLLLFTDLHLRAESEDVCFQVLDGILEASDSVDAVAFLGDFWHMRYQVPVHLLNRVGEWIHKMLQKKGPKGLIFLPGNHDQINLLGENALEVFQAHGARVYSVPTYDEWGAWMPYRKEEAQVSEGIGWLRGNATQRRLFAHLPVRGAMMNNMLEDDSGLPVGIFKGWQRVLLGHYHKRQEWLNGAMGYIGSPWQTRADEWGQPKGYAILDTDTNALTFVDCVWGPRFHRFDATVPIPSEAWGQVAPGDHLKVMVQNEEAALQTRKFLAEHLPPSVRVAVEAKEQLEVQPRFAFKKGTTLTEYAHHYVQDKKPKQLDPKSLMFFWSKITGMQP